MFHKKAVLKNFAVFTWIHTCVEISFLIKMQAFRAPALLKRDSNTGVFCEHWEIFKNTYFEEHLRTAASESFTWTFFYMNKYHRKWRRRFLKNKTKQKLFENSAIWKNLPFHDVLYHFVFLFFSTSRQTAFVLYSKWWY